MMIVFRYIGYFLAAFSLLVLGNEIGRYLDTNVMRPLSLRQTLSQYNPEAFDQVYGMVGSGFFSSIWHDVVRTIMHMPLLSITVLLAAFLIFIARHSDVNY